MPGMDTATPTPSRGDNTREALINAALTAFGRDGFAATSTRAIADAAGVQQALIGYHFRSKQGLYLAVFEFIVQQLQVHVGPVGDAIEAELAQVPTSAAAAGPERHQRYLGLLQKLTNGILEVMTSDRSAVWSQLILREQQTPTEAFQLLYSQFMNRMLGLVTRLVQVLLPPDADETQARLLVTTIFGQVLVFRAARAGMLRHMRWDSTGPDEVEMIRRRMHQNLSLLFPYPGQPA